VSGVVCWGANDRGQLGDITVLPTLRGATKIVAGANHTCAMSSGGVVCWGANESGQIGNKGSQVTGGVAPFTVPLTGNTGTVDIAAGSSHTCAIISGTGIDGTNGVLCWGANGSGQIDTNGVGGANRLSPTAMNPFKSPKLPDGIAAGRANTCIRRGTDEDCVGDNSSGQNTLATNLKGPSPFGLLVAGGDHTCLIDTTNEIRCFGRNTSNELGPFAPQP